MVNFLDHPVTFVAASLAVQWLAAYGGDFLRRKGRPVRGVEHEDFDKIIAAALTLLALIIGFSFSMAVSRYDQRKLYEEQEANAIGTEYARTELFPATDADKIQELLGKYVEQRILFYETQDQARLEVIDTTTAALQRDLWSAVIGPAKANPTPVSALAVAGMNDVLNSQGYTQAAWWNRVPTAAWVLMVVIAIAGNMLLGGSERRAHWTDRLLVLPVIVSVSLYLIAEIDSPRSGIVRVLPENLIAVSHSFVDNLGSAPRLEGAADGR